MWVQVKLKEGYGQKCPDVDKHDPTNLKPNLHDFFSFKIKKKKNQIYLSILNIRSQSNTLNPTPLFQFCSLSDSVSGFCPLN